MTTPSGSFERSHPDFRGSNNARLLHDDKGALIVDTLDVGLFGQIAPEDVLAKPKGNYRDNQELWHDLRIGSIRHGDTITLEDFQVLEWLPVCPGRYFMPEAERGRAAAEQFWDWTAGEYLPLGKLEMVLGGVGSVRLAPRFVHGGEVCFFGATSNGVSHQGLPVVIPIHASRTILQEIKARGACAASLTGTLWPLPIEMSPVQFDRGLPKYFLFAECCSPVHNLKQEALVTVAITYSSTSHDWAGNLSETVSGIRILSSKKALRDLVWVGGRL